MLEPGVLSSVVCLQHLLSWEVPSLSPTGVSSVLNLQTKFPWRQLLQLLFLTSAVCSRSVMSSFTPSHAWHTEESRSASPLYHLWETNVLLARRAIATWGTPAEYYLVLIAWERGRQLNWTCLQSPLTGSQTYDFVNLLCWHSGFVLPKTEKREFRAERHSQWRQERGDDSLMGFGWQHEIECFNGKILKIFVCFCVFLCFVYDCFSFLVELSLRRKIWHLNERTFHSSNKLVLVY